MVIHVADVVAAQVDVADLEDLVAVDQVDAADVLVIAVDVTAVADA